MRSKLSWRKGISAGRNWAGRAAAGVGVARSCRGRRAGDRPLFFEALAQGRERDFGERGDAEIGVGEIVVGGRRAGGGDAPEVGTFGGETAGV